MCCNLSTTLRTDGQGAAVHDDNAVADCLTRWRAGQEVLPGAAARVAMLTSPAYCPQPVIATDGRACVLDLGTGPTALSPGLAGLDATAFGALIDRYMADAGTAYAYGRWGEDRAIYASDNYATDGDRRTVHMGVDLFCAAGTPVHAPDDGIVHIVTNNQRELDYGPMLVLRHQLTNGAAWHSLYGHLDLASTLKLQAGQRVAAGERIAAIGSPPDNGNWPPHLHFQLILDLLGLGNEFPGVARASERDAWLTLSPNPARFFRDVDATLLDGRS